MRLLLLGDSTRGPQHQEPAAGRSHGGVPPLADRVTFACVAAATLALCAGSALARCGVEVEPVAFGVIDVVHQSRGNREIVVRCDEPAEFGVGISPGRGGAEGRRMGGPGGARLSYALFADPGHAIPWSDGQALDAPWAAAKGRDRCG
jgi:spore coat protein U-like protein